MVELKNGAKVLIRAARAADAGALQALFIASRRGRLHAVIAARSLLTYAELQNLCNVNHETEVAFLGVTGPRENEEVVGSACWFAPPRTSRRPPHGRAEWQGLGVGSALQVRLQEYA